MSVRSPLVGLQSNEGGAHRILIQGIPGTGKTYSALTFPNPLVVNFDNKLPRDRSINQIPFHTIEYMRSLYKTYGADPANLNLRDAFRMWLEKEMPKIDAKNTTLIIDSWTMVSNATVTQCMKERKPSKQTGELDSRQAWGELLNYMYYIHELLKRYDGLLISIAHEYIDRDEKGQPTSVSSPLFAGSFKDQFAAHYTNYWRMDVVRPPKDAPENTPSDYRWQLKGSVLFNSICSFTPPAMFVKADYDSIKDHLIPVKS